MKTQTSQTAVAGGDQTSPASRKSRSYRAALVFTAMFGLSACEVYPGGMGYRSGYGRSYSSGIDRYVNAYAGLLRAPVRSYGGYNPRGFMGGGSRHGSSYGVQHGFGQSFVRPGRGSFGSSHGGFGGSRGGFSGGHGGNRGRH